MVEGLQKIQELVNRGEIEALIRLVETFSGEERLVGDLFKAMYLLDTYEEIEQAKDLVAAVLATCQKKSWIYLHALLTLSAIYLWEGEFEKVQIGIDTIEERLAGVRSHSLYFLMLKSLFHDFKAMKLILEGNSKAALQDIESALYFANKYSAGPHYGKAAITGRKAACYYANGDWEHSMRLYKETLEILDSIDNERYKLWSYGGLAQIYILQGEYERAHQALKERLSLSLDLKHKRAIVESHNLLGKFYYNQGDLVKAQFHFEEAIARVDSINSDKSLYLSHAHFGLCQINLDQDKLDAAKANWLLLKTIGKKDVKIWSKILSKLAEAQILSKSKRFKEKSEAQMLLNEILKDSSVNIELKYTTKLILINLLLEEISILGDEDLYQNTKLLLDDLDTLVNQWNFPPAQVNALMLKSSFSLVDSEIDQAFRDLDVALGIAEKNKLPALEHKVLDRQKELLQEFSKWKEIIETDTSLKDRLENANVEFYLKDALKIVKNFSP